VSPGSAGTETRWIRRHWHNILGAEYRLADLTGLHWTDLSGGVRPRSPRPMVHGYVHCDQMIRGELSHSCEHGRPPHRVKVCVVAKDNSRQLMTRLKAEATAK
jgi:hypothetical protein